MRFQKICITVILETLLVTPCMFALPQDIYANEPEPKESQYNVNTNTNRHKVFDGAYNGTEIMQNSDEDKPDEISVLQFDTQTYSYDEMTEDIDNLIKEYPGKVQKITI